MNKLTSQPLIAITKKDDINSYPKASIFFVLSLPSTTNSNGDIKEKFETVAKKHHANCYFAILTDSTTKTIVISKTEVGIIITIVIIIKNVKYY